MSISRLVIYLKHEKENSKSCLFTYQFATAFAAHRLCALHLHTSHDNPCEVTERYKDTKFTFSFGMVRFNKNVYPILRNTHLNHGKHYSMLDDVQMI